MNNEKHSTGQHWNVLMFKISNIRSCKLSFIYLFIYLSLAALPPYHRGGYVYHIGGKLFLDLLETDGAIDHSGGKK